MDAEIYAVLEEFPVIVSVTYYALFFVLGYLGQQMVRAYIPDPYRPYLFTLVASFQALGCSLENGQIRYHYGFLAYFLTICILCSLYVTFLEASPNPCSFVVKYLHGTVALQSAVVGFLCQICGAVLAYHMARMFWLFELTLGHRNKVVGPCSTDLAWPAEAGFLLEFSGTLVDVLLGLLPIQPYIKCVISCLITTAGVSYTGMYLNPLNASNQTFGCEGTSIMVHLVVYWVAPLAATMAAVKLHEVLQK